MKWTFAINKSSYFNVVNEDELIWNCPKDVKKGELILIYTGDPYKHIEFVFTAKTNPFENENIRKMYNTQAIYVHNKIRLNEPITLKELRKNPVMSNWGAVKGNFIKSHWKMNEKEWNEMKKLILHKNPEIKDALESLLNNNSSECHNDNHRGRAHITRDTCYLIGSNDDIVVEEDLEKLLIESVGDNEDYWNAYFQNCIKENCVRYNIESARSLGLIDCDSLKLTGLGHELVNALEEDEVFTYNYGIGTKRFFYKLAQNDEIIKTAMDILKENESLRFWSPKCDRTQRVIWEYHQDNNEFVCDEKKYPECADCDHDVLNHVDQTSLVLETLKKTGKRSGFVFWFTSRVTPMHLTGQEPAYNGQTIYWDKKEDAIMQGQSTQDFSSNWVFAVNKENFNKLTDDVRWNSALEVKKDDLILFYRGEPESAITDIFKAKTDPYDDTETKEAIGGKAINLHKIATIRNPISWETLKNNPILKEWAGVKMNFGRSHFKTSDKVWDELKRLILEKNPELEDLISKGTGPSIPKPFQIINKLFDEFKTTYLPINEGIEHTNKYEKERLKVNNYFEMINDDTDAIYDVDDPPINHLLPIKEPSVAPAAVGDIKAFGYKNEDLPGLTIAIRDLINNLIENESKTAQKDLISTFKHSDYKSGFQTAMLTPTLYYLKPDFWFINKKTVATFNLLSELTGDNEKISGILEEYVDNNEKVHNLVAKIKEFIPELDFESFDAFCHWMSSNDLGNYANDKEKFRQWLIDHGFVTTPEYRSFQEFLTKKNYLYSPETVENYLLSLKVKPFVILTGNSGTGKTKIAQLFAQYLLEKNRDKKYILTTVKPSKSSIKYNLWTLDRSDLKPLNLDLEKYFEIKVENIPTSAKLSMSPRLWYEDPSGNIKAMLEKEANTNPNKELKIQLMINSYDSNIYEIVPVGANWTENRHLLGFFNVIDKNYQTTPALNLILTAEKVIISPHFLILDEMNLSHVERYFADFLSAMESDESIPLHSSDDDEIPRDLDIPRNLLVIGTVNVDETTYMFSPKVLDRANTIEFSTYPAKDYMHNSDENEAPKGDIEYLENPLSDLETRKLTVEDLKEHLKDVNINTNDSLWDVLADEIQAFQDVLGKAGFDFGFRVINEILRFMYVAWVYEGKPEIWDNWMRYFDAQIKQKMLPKLHGSQRVLEEVLKDLFELCYIDTVDSPPRYFEKLSTDPSVKYLESALKIQEMDKVLNEQRYVSFIN